MADLATVQAQLTEARAAYHSLMTGGKAVQVRTAEGRFVVYAQASASQLAAYIASLEAQEATLLGTRSGRRQPIYLSIDPRSCRRRAWF